MLEWRLLRELRRPGGRTHDDAPVHLPIKAVTVVAKAASVADQGVEPGDDRGDGAKRSKTSALTERRPGDASSTTMDLRKQP
jgi:hypothetical protein